MASGRIIIPLAEPVLNSGGLVVTGATLTVYLTGTTTLATIYADAALGTPITNPQVSDAAGRFYQQSTEWWADASVAYDVKLALPDGSVFTWLAIYVLGAATNTSGFAPLNSPVFTGTPQAPTPATNDSSANIATTAFVAANVATLATLASPALTGVPTAPTAAQNTSTTQLATTAFVQAIFGGATLANPGAITFPGGFRLKWNFETYSRTGDGAGPSITFAAAFPNTCLGVMMQPANAASDPNSDTVIKTVTTTNSGFSTYINTTAGSATFTNFWWFAWGY